ncbi:CDP-diacylglycerol--glycerol-3-phosphate 3-phosphatidyltransferase 2-like [Dioscorea cayenensis subsp. rotundata]|uniref:CDP-diacylglycerol--glycerol-3-phosphate 3-phosphatidyltransferase 2-like n=1 Tax=Dioscorea cayennensis subsp. rotundata TaxID=55577 RepID=A0AB40CZK8_DIOCR|nr:CDP-diacylglycerol--glycerol-3-phosphate 3-phosphatidyltransferase 2-like [Dioscorea cayenensis subsp. rotundata]XP_039144272.1 CDP-diacylglycerol--glycerol-3-phosphate 3-phosphatidyltransferase 2-like [Dioscorea cayenensis subsp. rotundata]
MPSTSFISPTLLKCVTSSPNLLIYANNPRHLRLVPRFADPNYFSSSSTICTCFFGTASLGIGIKGQRGASRVARFAALMGLRSARAPYAAAAVAGDGPPSVGPGKWEATGRSGTMGSPPEVEGIDGGFRKEGKEEGKENRLLTLPTLLTLGRVAAVPLLIGTFYMDGRWATTVTTSIFVGAAITDWLDGYLARKMQLGTAFGAFLDPVADKLMVAAALVLLCTKPHHTGMNGDVSWLLTVPSIAIIGREITMSAVREWAASQNTKVLEAVAVNNLGKWKTATQMVAITILLGTRDPSLAAPGLLIGSGVTLLYISAGLAIWSLAVYMKKIWRVLLK